MVLTGGWLRAVVGATLLSMTVGCGGLGPGDYVVYRVAMGQTTVGADCLQGLPLPSSDSSSYYTSDTFILYATTDETFYLDIGSVTLQGSLKEGDQYEFRGSATTSVTTSVRTSNSTIVEFTVDGEVIEGSKHEVVDRSCVGISCSTSDNTSCTQTTPFVGTEVEDVEIKHEV